MRLEKEKIKNNLDKEKILKDLLFDETNIDKAVTEQASLFFYYGMKWVDAVNKMNAIKMDLEMLKARLYKKYRTQLENGKGKTTEGMIESSIITDSEYIKMMEDYRKAKEEAEEWGVVKDAFKQRKDLLEVFVNMLMSLRAGEKPISVEADMIRHRLKKKLSLRQ